MTIGEWIDFIKACFRERGFYSFLFLIINLLLLLFVTFNAQISFDGWFYIFSGVFGFAFVIHHFKVIPKLNSIPKMIYYPVLTFGIINLFFLVNDLFSSNPELEAYSFKNHRAWHQLDENSRGRMENTSLIHLEGNKYKNIIWNRVFFDVNETKHNSVIEYKFEQGLLGVRVLKDYKFKHSEE